MNKDYLRGVIDATIELNKLAGIESTTIIFVVSEEVTRLVAVWESDVKVTAPADYWNPQETETVFTSNHLNLTHLNLTDKTTVFNIVNFISECTEVAMKDEYNNL